MIWAPEVAAPETLEKALADAGRRERLIVFCDEEAPQASPLDELGRSQRGAWRRPAWSAPRAASTTTSGRRSSLLPRVVRLSLGPRILRADTAAVAALALIQATLGDWPKWRRSDRA